MKDHLYVPWCISALMSRQHGIKLWRLQWAALEVDADAIENANVRPQLEPGEFIEVFLVPFQGLHDTLMVSQHQRGCWALAANATIIATTLQLLIKS